MQKSDASTLPGSKKAAHSASVSCSGQNVGRTFAGAAGMQRMVSSLTVHVIPRFVELEMQLQEFGKIKLLHLPDEWVEKSQNEEFSEIATFAHPTETDVKLSFYYRGKPLSKPSAQNLQKVLDAPPHLLSDDERLSIEVILRDASEPEYFDLRSIQTIEVNGLMVLICEGYWKLSDVDSLGVFVKSNEEGCRIDEIYYVAPRDKFAKYLPLAQQAIQSIHWNSD